MKKLCKYCGWGVAKKDGFCSPAHKKKYGMPTNKRKGGVKRVKGFATLTMKNKIENADYFSPNDCCNAEETQALAIYRTKDEAETMNTSGYHTIVPCEIIYHLPTKR